MFSIPSKKKRDRNARFSIEFLSPCGIFCGVCPQFSQENPKCGGCTSNRGFARVERKLCGIVKCCRKQHIQRCNECSVFEKCSRLKRFIGWDSFVTHAACLDNLRDLNRLGEEAFIEQLKTRFEAGTFPPAAKPGGITLKNLWHMSKPPFKPSQK